MSDTPAAQKARYERLRLTPEGRATFLIAGARNRAKDYTPLTHALIAEKIRHGCCAVTGIPFEMASWPDTRKNPYAPSLDRIDPARGYTDDNIQVVVWAYNLLKGELPDACAKAIILAMAQGLLEKSYGTRNRIAA